MLAMTLTVNLTSWQKKISNIQKGAGLFLGISATSPPPHKQLFHQEKENLIFSSMCFPGFECPNIVLSSPNSKRTSGQPLESSA